MDLSQKFFHFVNPRAKIALSHVTAVGALFELHQTENLVTTDDFLLEDTFEILAHFGIGLSREFQIDVINLSYGRDFLPETTETDLVVLHNIYSRPQHYDHIPLDHYVSRRDILRMSPCTHDSESWKKRIIQSNAKFVVCRGNESTQSVSMEIALQNEIGAAGQFSTLFEDAVEKISLAGRKDILPFISPPTKPICYGRPFSF